MVLKDENDHSEHRGMYIYNGRGDCPDKTAPRKLKSE